MVQRYAWGNDKDFRADWQAFRVTQAHSGTEGGQDLRSAAAAFIITDISRDGMLVGPDVDGLLEASRATGLPVIASGGVGTLDHLRQLSANRELDGVIVGKAIYEARFSVAEAIGVLS